MIDLICIFTTGGVILFYKALTDQVNKNLVQQLIQNNIATKKDKSEVSIDQYLVQYIRHQKENLIFAVAVQKFLNVENVHKLLENLKESYIQKALPELVKENNIIQKIPSYNEEFEIQINAWVAYNLEEKKKKKAPKTYYQTKDGKEKLKTTQQSNEKLQEEAQKQIINQKLKKKSSTVSVDNSSPKSDKGKKQKVMRESTSGKVTKQAMEQLNKSKTKEDDDDVNIQNQLKEYMGGENEKIKGFDVFSSDDEEEEKNKKKKKGFFSKLGNQVSLLTGNKNIEESDLEPVLVQFKHHLAGKNVAEEMSQKICDSIKINMLNMKSQALTSLNQMVKTSLEQTLTKILTPKRNIDPIAEALRAKQKGKPYVMAFIGVNGVGKSTNLAKVAYMFKSQGFKIMLAACDNFRAGAVEQIKTHGRCLDIPVFDKGYGQDAADIAFEAIREAQLKKYDVVLIDTAGRMQDNEPLMKQLSKLIIMNNPDLVVFIGEALVGNDGLDQLTKFNKALIDLSPRDNIREIDGIILSKFDTVDDKVGAAITMTYNSGKPILFVGIGQKYTHLRKLNVKTVVHSLLE